ncbi:MAG TPA: gamma-aminobutyraldehyde dehydrogenase, partial [Streptomyces sp.]|nr:gamma-aminobutyraldehyde dehydrogenase [Streptomyces sp.]
MGNRFQVQDRFAAGAQYIGGQLRAGTSGRTHAVVNPATGEEIYEYELAGTADVD